MSSSTRLPPTPDAAEGGGRGGSQHPDKRAETNRTINLSDVIEHVLPTPKTKDRASRGPAATGGPDLGESIALLISPTTSEGTGIGRGVRRRESTLRGQVDRFLPTPATGRGRHNSDGDPMLYGAVEELLPTPRATDGTNGGPNQRGSAGDLALPSAALQLMPTPDAQMGGAGGRSGDPELTRAAGHHVTINEVAQHLPTPSTMGGGETRRGGDRYDEQLLPGVVQDYAHSWGPYEPAIRRWERILGRLAPWATEPSARSKKGRLSPRFVEWMMGWAEGWVTSLRLSRNQQLKILGNGVVPQQATEAVLWLLTPPPVRRAVPNRPRKSLRKPTPKGMLKAATAPSWES